MRLARTIRKNLGKSLVGVAADVGIDKSVLSRFELGQQGVRLPTLQALATYYQCSMDELLQQAPDEVASARQPLRIRDVLREGPPEAKHPEALLELIGLGKEIWDEHPDDYVRRLREPWYPNE